MEDVMEEKHFKLNTCVSKNDTFQIFKIYKGRGPSLVDQSAGDWAEKPLWWEVFS